MNETRPDRCPKCAYPSVVVVDDRGAPVIGGAQHGRCPRCRTEFVRAAGTPFWRRPSRQRRSPAHPRVSGDRAA